jgi:molybdopterin molybdotransferase
VGEVGLQSGSKLKPAHLAMAAMMGYAEIPVINPPKIAIIGTGDELVEPGQPLQSGQIYESNTTALVGLVAEMGCEPVKYPFVTDDLDGLRKTFDLAASECDAILTSGGVSMGEWDLVRSLMEEEGEVKFWKVLIKPGGPLLFGSWKNTPLFGLPGNPVSSQIVYLSIVVPWISNSCGYHPTQGPKLYDKVRVKLLSAARGTKSKVTMRRIQIIEQVNILVGDVPQNQGSGNLRSMVNCNGLTLLPIGVDGKSGDIIDALWLR